MVKTEATRAYRDAFERAFSAVMGMNVSVNADVSCFLVCEQFCSSAEDNIHLFWMCMRQYAHVSLCICSKIKP